MKMTKKYIKILSIFIVTIFLLNNNIVFSSNKKMIEPMAIRCVPHTSYSDYIDTTFKKQQFSHIVEKSSVPQTITRNVTLTSWLSVKGSISGESNIIIAKSKINFELGYVGSKSETVSITWGPIVNKKVKLVAGKVWAKTIGKKSSMDIYCNLTSKSYYIEGSYDNYSDAYEVK